MSIYLLPSCGVWTVESVTFLSYRHKIKEGKIQVSEKPGFGMKLLM